MFKFKHTNIWISTTGTRLNKIQVDKNFESKARNPHAWSDEFTSKWAVEHYTRSQESKIKFHLFMFANVKDIFPDWWNDLNTEKRLPTE